MRPPTVERLDTRTRQLEEVVAGLMEILAARGGGGPWWWKRLDRDQAARLWEELAEFVTYLSRRYLGGVPAEYQLGACWYRHPVAAELLTALMVAHIGAYRDAGAGAGPGAGGLP